MKLKSVNVFGFKTFADRANLHFNNGITGIIGPNGCGKSNTMDSIRWIIGDHNSKNRSPEEIIFAGSDARKPLGMAEVTLVFENDGKGCPQEFLHLPEVSLTRRIFRGGEREYLINKEPCRQKDIVELLAALGIGSRSYCIIEQEKRDRIIAASPDELREILEEAAGISVFKTHRKEAEKRLHSTSESLDKLANVEDELTQQCDHLREQVEKAMERKQLNTSLRTLELTRQSLDIHRSRCKIQDLARAIEEDQTKIQSQTIESGNWEQRANELKTCHNDLRIEIVELNKRLGEVRTTMARSQERLSNIKRTAEDNVLRRTKLEQQIADDQNNLKEMESKLAEYLNELDTTEKELRRLDADLLDLQNNLEEVDESLRVERGRHDELRSEIRTGEQLVTHLRGKNESILQDIQKTSSALKRIEANLTDAETERIGLEADRNQAEQSLQKSSSGMEAVSRQRADLAMALAEIDNELKTAQELANTARERHVEVKAQLNSILKLQQSNDGISSGAKRLHEYFPKAISGFVFERIAISQQDEPVLEAALPEFLQSICLQDAESFVTICDKIEENNLTRTGLIVTDWLQPLSQNEESIRAEIQALPGIRNVGARADSTSDPTMQHLLNRIFIASDEWQLAAAISLAQSHGCAHFHFLSERGAFIGGLGQGAFGSPQDGEGVLQRRRHIAELTEQEDVAQREFAAAQGQVFIITERRKGIVSEIVVIDEQISREKNETIKLASSLDSLTLRLRHNEEGLTRLRREQEQYSQDLNGTKALYAKNQAQIDQVEKEIKGFQNTLEDFEEQLDELKEQRNTYTSKLQFHNANRGVIGERQANARKNYEEVHRQVERLRRRVDEGILELDNHRTQITSMDGDERRLEREIEQLKFDNEQIQLTLNEKTTLEAQADDELRELESRLKSQKQVGEAQEKLLKERRVQIEQCEEILKTAVNDVRERLNATPEELPPIMVEGVAAERKFEKELDRDISALRLKIVELGSVNERALEEFQSTETRRQFLIQQKQDILESVETLRGSIGRLEAEITTRFREIFEKIDSELQRIFPKLAPGGYARLNLTKPDDLLSTGVEILAKLPGKSSAQKMHVFSGGEKALTAVSLIFALLCTQPSPFCFLDEVDAPLDEANVGRFNELLDELSADFQFIVISHNRRTMEVFDTIYGVTMQTPGVSKIVGIDYSEANDILQKANAKKKPDSMSRAGAEAAL